VETFCSDSFRRSVPGVTSKRSFAGDVAATTKPFFSSDLHTLHVSPAASASRLDVASHPGFTRNFVEYHRRSSTWVHLCAEHTPFLTRVGCMPSSFYVRPTCSCTALHADTTSQSSRSKYLSRQESLDSIRYALQEVSLPFSVLRIQVGRRFYLTLTNVVIAQGVQGPCPCNGPCLLP